RRYDTLVGARLRPCDRRQPDREPIRDELGRDIACRKPPLPASNAVPPWHGCGGTRARARLRCDRIRLGWPLVGREGLSALLRLRPLAACQAAGVPRALPLTWLFVPADRPARV